MGLEERLRPEVRASLAIIERNREYLAEEGIIGGEQTFKGTLENFYDLKYTNGHFMSPPGFGRPPIKIPYKKLNLGEAKKENYRKIPRELAGILDEFREVLEEERIIGKLIHDIGELDYERVRESFNEPKFPLWKETINVGIGLVGFITAPIALASSIAISAKLNDPTPVYFGVLASLSLVALAIYMPIKNKKDQRNFIDTNTSEETKKRNEAFWVMGDTANKADLFMKKYNEFFLY